jgi:hypothetical protein
MAWPIQMREGYTNRPSGVRYKDPVRLGPGSTRIMTNFQVMDGTYIDCQAQVDNVVNALNYANNGMFYQPDMFYSELGALARCIDRHSWITFQEMQGWQTGPPSEVI